MRFNEICFCIIFLLAALGNLSADDYYDDEYDDAQEDIHHLSALEVDTTIQEIARDESFDKFKNISDFYGAHYSTDIYKGFSIERALSDWSQQTFSINYFDPRRGRLYVSGKVNLWERSVSNIVKELCSVLIDDALKTADQSAWLRCTVPATQTVRMRLIQVIANISQRYEYAPFEEEIFSYLHAYHSPVLRPGLDAVRSIEDPKAGRSCILGSASPHVLLSIFASGLVNRVIVFSRPFKTPPVEVPPRETIWDKEDALKAATFFNVSLEMLPYSVLLEEYWKYRNSVGKTEKELLGSSPYAHVCDYIHVSADVFPTAVSPGKDDYSDSIAPLAKFLSQRYPRLQPLSSHHDPNHYIARVIWQNKIQQSAKESPSATPPGSKYINWKFSSTWFDNCYTGNTIDRNGFVDKMFGTWQRKTPFKFSSIEIGYFKGAEETLTNAIQGEVMGDGSSIPVPQGPEDRDFLIIFITATYRIFVDNMFALQLQLQTLGYRNVVLFPELTIQAYETYEALAKQIGARIVHLVLTPMDFGLIARDNIIFNSEQIYSKIVFNDGEQRYKYLYTRALQFWHYQSGDGAEEMLKGFEKSLKTDKHILQIVPFYYPKSRLEVLKNMNITTTVEPLHDHSIRMYPNALHVVFFGGCNDRRSKFLEELRLHLAKRPSDKDKRINLMNFCGYYTHDYERDFYLVNADVVINISIRDDSSLETHRINHLLSLGKIVISEEGVVKGVADMYREGVIFVKDSIGMANVLSELADSHEAFQIAHTNAVVLQNYLQEQSFVALKNAMIAVHIAIFGEYRS